MPLTEDQIRHALHMRKTLPVVVGRRKSWLRDLMVCIAQRDRFRSDQARAILFWIRLRGVLHELTLDENQRFDEVWADTPRARELRELVKIRPETRALNETAVLALKALRGALDEHELIAIDYLRHLHCHPQVHAYLYRLESGGSRLVDTYQPALVSVPYDIGRLHRIVQDQLDKHGGDAGLAAHIAARIETPALAVWKAFQPMFEPEVT